MGEAACDLLAVELALDLIEARLAIELPPHMRAFAAAHAAGRTVPNAPGILGLPSTLQTARNACLHDLLTERGLALLRLVASIAIEDDPHVSALRAGPPSWSGLTALAAARDVASRRRFGRRTVEIIHRLHGAREPLENSALETTPPEVSPSPPEVVTTSALPGWRSRDRDLDGRAIDELWDVLSSRFGVRGSVSIERTAGKPRTFVVDPGVEVIVVVPSLVASPAARFAVLHELGHAIAALALPAGIPRALDEAVAALVARLPEAASWLPAVWRCDLARAARLRRTAIARLLASIEDGLPELPAVPPAAAPPQALWEDPGAQGCYVEAEAISDRLDPQLREHPQDLRRILAPERDLIDRRASVIGAAPP